MGGVLRGYAAVSAASEDPKVELTERGHWRR